MRSRTCCRNKACAEPETKPKPHQLCEEREDAYSLTTSLLPQLLASLSSSVWPSSSLISASISMYGSPGRVPMGSFSGSSDVGDSNLSLLLGCGEVTIPSMSCLQPMDKRSACKLGSRSNRLNVRLCRPDKFGTCEGFTLARSAGLAVRQLQNTQQVLWMDH